jgi:hypothetical protein
MSNSEIYRPRSSYFFAGAIYILCAGIAAQSFFSESYRGIATTISWALLISYLFHLGFIRPKVTFFDEGITITNPLREITFGWDRVQEISAQYSMYIQVDGEKIYAWAAQAPGRYHTRNIHSSELRGMNLPDPLNIRAGESPRTHSGVAVAIARIRRDNFISKNLTGCDSRTDFNRGGASTLALLGIATCLITLA